MSSNTLSASLSILHTIASLLKTQPTLKAILSTNHPSNIVYDGQRMNLFIFLSDIWHEQMSVEKKNIFKAFEINDISSYGCLVDDYLYQQFRENETTVMRATIKNNLVLNKIYNTWENQKCTVHEMVTVGIKNNAHQNI